MRRQHRRPQDNLNFEIGIRRPPSPPIALGFVAAPDGEREEEGVERLQGCGAVREGFVDLTPVQKSARAPDEAPLQAVGHAVSSPRGSALAQCFA